MNGAIITCANVYEYKGYIFEWHHYLGPTICRKDGEISKRQPGEHSRFWKVLAEWQKLSKARQEKTRYKHR